MDFQVRVSQSADGNAPDSRFNSKKNSTDNPNKALIRMKIIEFHKAKQPPSLGNRIPASFSNTSVDNKNFRSSTSLLPNAATTVRKNRHTEALKTKEVRLPQQIDFLTQ